MGNMEISNEILSDIALHMKYARYISDKNRRETWEENVTRNKDMHLKSYPQLEDEINEKYQFVYDKKVLPSMRSAQFAGKPIEISPNRIYNCCYLPVDDWRAFHEIMFLLLGGTGVGYSVQRHHVNKMNAISLPETKEDEDGNKVFKRRRFLIGDSIEGWADAVKALMRAFLDPTKRTIPDFDYRDIRPKGARLVTSGGKAPGPDPLKRCLNTIEDILVQKKNGEQLTPIEVHDIVCHIADAVLAGGIRRAALISLFSFDDEDMIVAKSNFEITEWEHVVDATRVDEQGEPVDTIQIHEDARGNKYYDLKVNVLEPFYGASERACYWVSEDDVEQLKNEGTLPWYCFQPQRGRANNSAVALRHLITKDEFLNLWQKVEDSGSGEPGIYFSNDKDWGANPSLRKGTRVYTTDGVYPIEELEDKEFLVKNLNGEISKARCWLSGNDQRLYKITLEGGHEYYATKEHEWPIWDQSKETYVKKNTPNVKSGDRMPFLRENHLFDGSIGSYDDGFYVGWMLGDGWVTKRSDNNKMQYGAVVSSDEKYIADEKLIPHLEKVADYSGSFSDRGSTYEMNTSSIALTEYASSVGVDKKENGLPNIVWTEATEEYRKGVIDGLFSADGHVSKNDKRVSLSTSHEKLAQDVADLLGFYGIKVNISKRETSNVSFPNGKTYDRSYVRFAVRIDENASIQRFIDLFSLSNKEKQARLNSYTFTNRKQKDYRTVVSVEETDLYEDVWDIAVYDETHCFQLPHVVTGNCGEIALRPFQFCNLTEINASDIESQEDLNERARVGAFLGTLQAGYTDFHYLRPKWKEVTEKEALIGVGMTGIASNKVDDLDLAEAAHIVKEENARVAEIIGINKAARTTTVKPSGTSSLILGCSSGIHGWHAPYYIRRIRVGKNEAIYTYLAINHPELIEDDIFQPNQAVISIPQKAPEGSTFRDESALALLERVKRFNLKWVREGHRSGQNANNVSCTVSIRDDEWWEVGEWMWANRDTYNGIAVLPYNGGTYKQAPFEDCDEETYKHMMKDLEAIDLTQVIETQDNTDLQGELACAADGCEVA